MINIDDFSKMMSFELKVLHSQVDGLTHEDSLLQPEPGGNCMNWILGHLGAHLIEILEVLEEEPPKDLPDLSRYRINSEPILSDEDGVLHLPVLINTYSLLTEKIVKSLALMTVDDFETEVDFWQGKSRRGYVALFYFFHNTYHLGQLEFLRNLAGKP